MRNIEKKKDWWHAADGAAPSFSRVEVIFEFIESIPSAGPMHTLALYHFSSLQRGWWPSHNITTTTNICGFLIPIIDVARSG